MQVVFYVNFFIIIRQTTLLFQINGGGRNKRGVCKFSLLSANSRGRGVNIFSKKVFFGHFSVYYIWIFVKNLRKLWISRNLSSNFVSKIPKINKRPPPRLFGTVEYCVCFYWIRQNSVRYLLEMKLAKKVLFLKKLQHSYGVYCLKVYQYFDDLAAKVEA